MSAFDYWLSSLIVAFLCAIYVMTQQDKPKNRRPVLFDLVWLAGLLYSFPWWGVLTVIALVVTLIARFIEPEEKQ